MRFLSNFTVLHFWYNYGTLEIKARFRAQSYKNSLFEDEKNSCRSHVSGVPAAPNFALNEKKFEPMHFHYLKLAIRLLIRNPFFTIINVVGLSVGFAVFFILWEYSQSELSTDRYHRDADRIARVSVDWKWTDDNGKTWGHLLIAANSSGTIHKVSQDFAEV